MIDDLVELAAAASADVALERAAKRHRWVRIARGVITLLFVALLIAAVYVTIKYS